MGSRCALGTGEMVLFPSVASFLPRSNGKGRMPRLSLGKQGFYWLCTIWGRNGMLLLKGEEKLKPLEKAVREDLCEVSLVEKIMATLFSLLRPRRTCLLIFIALPFVPSWYRVYAPEVFAQPAWIFSWFPISLGRVKRLEPCWGREILVSTFLLWVTVKSKGLSKQYNKCKFRENFVIF